MEVRQQALIMVDTEGVKKTSEMMHITKLTLYRWRNEAIIGTAIALDVTKKTNDPSVSSPREQETIPSDMETPKLASSSLDEPANEPMRETALETAKQLLLEESDDRAARLQSLEAENAKLRSVVAQLYDRCERYRDALVALIR